jgi:hypothetical protein
VAGAGEDGAAVIAMVEASFPTVRRNLIVSPSETAPLRAGQTSGLIGSSNFLWRIVSAMFIGVNSGAPTTELDREALGRR